MTVNKLKRFAEVAKFKQVFEYTDYQRNEKRKPLGKWQKHIVGNDNTITLEIACGTGTYTLELPRRYPEHNYVGYVGIDIKEPAFGKGRSR